MSSNIQSETAVENTVVSVESLVEADSLVEEVCIDGMCGVY